MSKICKKCGRELPLECFSKDKSRRDGLQPYCKECKKQYNAEHADAIKQYFKQWEAEHAEHLKEYKKQYNKQYNKQHYATIEGYARAIRKSNLQKDRKYGRIEAEEDPLPTIEEYIELLQQRDFYDGKQYHWSEMGLDRIDNSKPHTIDNVVPCSTKNNIRRKKMSFEEFYAKKRGLGVSPTS